MRRRPPEDPDHHERWMVSYADFVTLLFAFFVVMYAISSINEGKYKQMTQSMIAAFNQGSISPKVIGQSGSANTHVAVEDANPMTSKVAASLKQQQDMRMRQLAAQVRQLLDPLMQRGQVRVTDSPLGIAVEINDSALFESGQATPSTASVGWLGRLGGVLKAIPTASGWKATPTTGRFAPASTPPTGNYPPPAPAAWCACLSKTASPRRAWWPSAAPKTARWPATTTPTAAPATAG